jgi:hypothetical protein
MPTMSSLANAMTKEIERGEVTAPIERGARGVRRPDLF